MSTTDLPSPVTIVEDLSVWNNWSEFTLYWKEDGSQIDDYILPVHNYSVSFRKFG